jgi:thiol-disulfide isomerase/thioredoxin
MKALFLIALLFLCISVHGQPIYKTGDKVADFAIPTIINSPTPVSNLSDIKKDIVILDFFGTWCAPCIKALPHLSLLQEKYKDRIAIILLSNEQQPKLEKFISNRQPFSFPVIVDSENKITSLFTPPSYPYTVVMDANKNILALTDAASITTTKIEEWLMTKPTAITPVATVPATPNIPVITTTLTSANKLVQLSQQFMYAAKTGDSTNSFVTQLAGINYNELLTQLQSDDEKKAFWINLYNAYTQFFLKQNPNAYKKRSKFFGAKQITIAGNQFSLDKIEHGILRRSKIKWSLGYLSKWFPGSTEKQLRVNALDYRLHFALNCGAKSCPPIAFYSPENINPQLNLAATAYLKSEVAYDNAANIIQLPTILSWFRRDFGGKKKIIQLLKEKNILPETVYPKIKFKKYDWTLYTNNYSN